MPRLLLMPVAILLSAGAVLLGPGEQPSTSPVGEQSTQRVVQVDLAGYGN